MEEALIKAQWDKKGWIWVENEELTRVLKILSCLDIKDVLLKFTASGYFIHKMY